MLGSVTRMFQSLFDLAENRVELFLIESKEQRARMFGALLLAATAIVFAFMTLAMVTLIVLVIFWDTHRLLVLTVLTAGYAVPATVAFVRLRSVLHRWQAYSATLEEFKKDRACFKKQN